jgi:large subunit ribosomal protein L21
VYAIFEDGGRQYKVNRGDKIYVALRDLREGQDTGEVAQGLMSGEGAGARIGQPVVEGAKVVGKVEREVKDPRVISFKMRRRKNYRRKIGHRQRNLQVTISDIVA